MSKPIAVVFCPGRGSYGREELSFIAKHRRPGAVADALDEADAARSSGETITDLDAAKQFRPGVHLNGVNAAELIYFSTLLHLEQLRERYKVAKFLRPRSPRVGSPIWQPSKNSASRLLLPTPRAAITSWRHLSCWVDTRSLVAQISASPSYSRSSLSGASVGGSSRSNSPATVHSTPTCVRTLRKPPRTASPA
jgi:hypothetical protein